MMDDGWKKRKEKKVNNGEGELRVRPYCVVTDEEQRGLG